MLRDLVTNEDIRNMFVIAAACGAIGGVVAQIVLILNQTLAPKATKVDSSSGIGRWSWILHGFVGAVAALIALWLLDLTTTTTIITAADGTTETKDQYHLIKLVGMSLTVGTTGAAFIAAAQARVLAAANAAALNAEKEIANEKIRNVGMQIGQIAGDEVRKQLEDVRVKMRDVLDQASESAPGTMVDKFEELGLIKRKDNVFMLDVAAPQDGGVAKQIEVPLPSRVDEQRMTGQIDNLIHQAANDVTRSVQSRMDDVIKAAQRPVHQ